MRWIMLPDLRLFAECLVLLERFVSPLHTPCSRVQEVCKATQEQAEAALIASKGRVDEAIDILLANGVPAVVCVCICVYVRG